MVLSICISVFSEYLVVYPDGYSLKNEEIKVGGKVFSAEIPSSIMPSTLIFSPAAKGYEITAPKLFDLDKELEKNTGKTIKWLFPDGRLESYELLSFNPIVLKGSSGIFNPNSGIPVFPEVSEFERRTFLQAGFSQQVEECSYSYLFSGIGYSVNYSLTIKDKFLSLTGNLEMSNSLSIPLKTDNLYIFSGSANFSTSDSVSPTIKYRSNEIASGLMDYSSPSEISDYRLYKMEGSYEIPSGMKKYFNFYSSEEKFSKIYKFSSYYSNPSGEYTPMDQTIKITKLSKDLPAGKARIFMDFEGKKIFLGEDTVSNKSLGDSLEVSYGKSSDILGKLEMTASRREGNTYIQSYRFNAKNLGEVLKFVSFEMTIPQDSLVTADNIKYSRPKANLISIDLTVFPKKEEEVLFEIQFNR